MGTPAHKRTVADLSRIEILDVNLRKALEDLAVLTAYINKLRGQIKAEMGDHEVAEINGVVRYTYARTDSYQWGKFAEEHGDIADKYKITVEQVVLDKDKLLAEHPAILADYRSRQFLVK